MMLPEVNENTIFPKQGSQMPGFVVKSNREDLFMEGIHYEIHQ